MQLRRALPLSAALLASAAATIPAAVPAAANHEALFALEIFAPEGPVPAPRCAADAADAQPAPPAHLPAGTISVAVLQGSLPSGIRGCRVAVSVGGGTRINVYKSAETQIRKRPLLRSGVRVVAARDEQTGVLVAERFVGRANAGNEIERAFLVTVTVDQRSEPNWLTTEIGGTDREFLFNVVAGPAEVEAPADTAAEVAIEFDTAAPAPD